MDNKEYTRAEKLLLACLQIFEKQDESPYVLNCLEMEVHYDDADCDGTCLQEDIKVYFDYERDLGV